MLPDDGCFGYNFPRMCFILYFYYFILIVRVVKKKRMCDSCVQSAGQLMCPPSSSILQLQPAPPPSTPTIVHTTQYEHMLKLVHILLAFVGMSGGGIYLPFHCDCELECYAQDCQMAHVLVGFSQMNYFVVLFIQLQTGTNDALSLPPRE